MSLFYNIFFTCGLPALWADTLQLAHVWGVCGACELAFGHSQQSPHQALVQAPATHKVC